MRIERMGASVIALAAAVATSAAIAPAAHAQRARTRGAHVEAAHPHAAAAKRSRKHGKAGHGGGEAHLEASIVIKLTPPEESLPVTDRINLYVPQRFRDAGASLPHCDVATLLARGAEGCSKGSIVGGGTATGYTILGGQFVIEHLTVTLVNGPHAELLSWVEGRTPVVIEQVVEGAISKPHPFGEEMSFTLPHGLLEPVPGAAGWLQTLDAHLSAKPGWLRTTSCPPHPWALKAELAYENGQGTTIETRLRCASGAAAH